MKSYGHLCQICQNYPLNMVMSRDPGFKFRKFLFSPNFVLNLIRKSYQIWEKLAQEQKSYRQKTHWGGGVENIPLPVLIGLNHQGLGRVKGILI